MDKPRKETAQEIVADTGAILKNVGSVLNDHEQRLRMIERLDLDIVFNVLRRRITLISSIRNRLKRYRFFKRMCVLLGISEGIELNVSVRDIFWL